MTENADTCVAIEQPESKFIPSFDQEPVVTVIDETYESTSLEEDFEDTLDMDTSSIVVDNATEVTDYPEHTGRPRKKQKRKTGKSLASDNALHELVEKGITGQGLSTATSRIKYVVIDDFRAIMNAMTRVEPDPNRIDVLTHCHNCIHTAYGFTSTLFNAVPKLREADANTSKSDMKIGTFSTVSHTFKVPRTETFVNRMFNTLYVQFCHYQPKRGNPKEDKHVDIKSFRRGFRRILKTYPSTANHGLVIFGDDKIFPTKWSEIEDELEEMLEQQDTNLTVFVPRSYAVSCTQKLDGKLAPFLRKVGLYL